MFQAQVMRARPAGRVLAWCVDRETEGAESVSKQ